MAGIQIQKNYISSNLTNVSLANNWMVLVFGVTNQGPTTPTLVQSYTNFTKQFGQPVSGVATHQYVQYILNSGVPVLFKRVIDTDKLVKASIEVKDIDLTKTFFTIVANDTYSGEVGNKISVSISQNETTNACSMKVLFDGSVVETFNLGVATPTITIGDLLYAFVKKASSSMFESSYITLNLDATTPASDWTSVFGPSQEYKLSGGMLIKDNLNETDLEAAIAILKDFNNSFWSSDKKLTYSATYYPQLRFVTTGGLIASDVDDQNTINSNLGKYIVACGTSFRALIDYPLGTKDLTKVVRSFASNEAAEGVSTGIYSFVGDWVDDGNGNWLPGSAGMLSNLGLANYNVYSRRIAGSGFKPASTKAYTDLYIDALNDWQAEDAVQLNPIMIIDAQGNLAVMGSSTLAMPAATGARNPEQALDVVLVGDYVAAILNGIALGELEGAMDRLSLNSLSNRMSQSIEKFVTSRAITRYDLNFDTTQIGKLGIYCTLYFAIGLEEVSLTITSVYDTVIA